MTHQRLTSLKCPSLTGADWLGLGYQILSYGQFAYNRDSGHGSQFLLEWSPTQICHRPICPSLHFAKVAKVALWFWSFKCRLSAGVAVCALQKIHLSCDLRTLLIGITCWQRCSAQIQAEAFVSQTLVCVVHYHIEKSTRQNKTIKIKHKNQAWMSTKRFACPRMADYPTVVPDSLQESTILVDLFRPGSCSRCFGKLQIVVWSNISCRFLGTYGHTRTHHSYKHFRRFLNLSLSVATQGSRHRRMGVSAAAVLGRSACIRPWATKSPGHSWRWWFLDWSWIVHCRNLPHLSRQCTSLWLSATATTTRQAQHDQLKNSSTILKLQAHAFWFFCLPSDPSFMFVLSLHFNTYECDLMSFASADILTISWFISLCAYSFRNQYIMLRPELPAATDASLRPNLLEMEQPEHSKLCLGKRSWRMSTIFEHPADLRAPVTVIAWQRIEG